MHLEDTYKPHSMLVLYTTEETIRRYNNNIYFETHKIVNGKPTAGVPLSESAANKLSIALNKNTKFEVGGFIPNNIIYAGFNGLDISLIWHTPACIKRLLFKKSIGVETGNYPVPNLIWYYSQERLHLYAYVDKGDDWPTTVLYNAPFFNIDEKGSVCLGAGDSILKGLVSYHTLMKTVQDAFYKTIFSHTSNTKLVKGNVNVFYKKIKGLKEFPNKDLLKYDKTLNKILYEKRK